MSHRPVGIRALSVSFPTIIRDNDYFRREHPSLVAEAEQKTVAQAFSTASALPGDEVDLWSQEVAPYLKDPFRGTLERRVLGPEESSLTMEYRAACDALAAANLSPEDVDLLIVVSLFPEQLAPGDAAFLAGMLGIKCPAWNLESTCSSAVVALQTATALVRAGEYRNVLVVVSNTYSRFMDENDTLMFLSGDGAGAFLVDALKEGQGVLATKLVNTSATCGVFYVEHVVDPQGRPRAFIRAGRGANKMFQETTIRFIRSCCEAAVASAKLSFKDIDFFIFSSPAPWYTRVCSRSLGVDPERTINMNSHYGNIGPVLPIANLYHAARLGKIRENDLVLFYGIGSSSNAGANVMRWGDVALGPAPATSAGR